jgi:peroxiredoxin Q/BCP
MVNPPSYEETILTNKKRKSSGIVSGEEVFMRLSTTLALVTLLGSAAAATAQAPAPPVELKVGDLAPSFKLQASDGKTYQLSDFKGKKAVVIAWFPKAFTSGCTIECKSLAKNGDMIRKYDVAYFMASVDPVEGEKGNKAFAESEKADFPLLGDPTKETAKAYGVLNPEWGAAYRWTFYIDKDGRIAAIDKAVKPATSAEDMVAKLAELKVPTRGD